MELTQGTWIESEDMVITKPALKTLRQMVEKTGAMQKPLSKGLGMRDVGCGWGAQVIGVTTSGSQLQAWENI